MLNPAPAPKLKASSKTKDFETENARRDKVVSATPPQIIHRSSSLPDANEEGYDTTAYPKDKLPTSRPTS